MALLGKRKAAADYELPITTRSRKQTKIDHAPKKPLPRTISYEANKENIDLRPKRKRGQDTEQDAGKRLLPTPPSEPQLTPKSKRVCQGLPPSPSDTPSRRTARLFDRLDLKTAAAQTSYSTPPATPPKEISGFADILPPAVTELLTFHAAFLSAINGQTALDSATFRLSVQEVLSATTSTWKRRTATLEDIRRVLALANLDWSLEDFGRAGLSLIRQSKTQRNISILDSTKMKREFELDLRRQYTQWQQQSDAVDGSAFIEQLPLASIISSESVEKATQTRGKERLDSIKSAQACVSTPTTPVVSTDNTTKSRSSSLLDRVLAKQATLAALPAGPSKAQLERKSSLQRVEEIARILDVLSGGRARASFSMLSVVQQVQQSLRSPMSRVEVERCLSIMATEIMPQFVSIVASGSVIGVVITRAGKMGLADLKKTLADADL